MDFDTERGPVGRGGVLLGLLGLAAAAWFLLGRGGAPPAGGTLARARAEGVIRVAYANEAPFGYEDPATGRVTGEAPEIARVLFARLGIPRIEPTVADFGALIDGLKAGRWDVVAAGMYITPRRCREVAFSNPTYVVREALLVRAGNPLGLDGYGSLGAHATARLAVLGGSVQDAYARKLGVPDARIEVFADYATALVALRAGRVDALAATRLTAADLLRKAGTGLEAAEPFEEPVIDGRVVRGHGAFAFRPADVELRAAFDAELAGFLGTPEHLELVAPFGFGPHTLPGEATAAELCAAR